MIEHIRTCYESVSLDPVTTEAMVTNNTARLNDQTNNKRFYYHVSLLKRYIYQDCTKMGKINIKCIIVTLCIPHGIITLIGYS